jgi:hypothetical protein
MPKIVGYLEGSDSLWLTTLQANGFGTLPLGNGEDCHGLNLRLLTRHNRPDLIVCYLHKLIAPRDEDVPPEELLLPARLFNVPVLVACPRELHENAKRLLAITHENVELIDPAELLTRAAELLA